MLLNPPVMSAGARSRNAVRRAARALGYTDVMFGNLCAIPTPSVVEVNLLGPDAWALARSDLLTSLSAATAVMAAWGVAGLTGESRRLRDRQVEWLKAETIAGGKTHFWMVGGEPRHPSRWHQYVADKHGRTRGGPFDERIKQVLVAVPIGAGGGVCGPASASTPR